MTESISINPIGSQISKWGEGPIYSQDHLVYVDIEGHALISLDPKSVTEKIWEMGERIGTVVPRERGGFLCAGDSGIYSFDPVTEEKKIIADPEADKRPDNRFNDGKCDPEGRFWAGTISLVKKTGDANLYMLDKNGDLSLKIPGVTNSNGICWNAKATQMFYIDTPTKEIRAYPFDNLSGSIGEAKIIVNTENHGWEGSPDGMTIDSEDMLWVAMCHGGSVLRIDPNNGSLLQKIDLPCLETTSCAFGGDALNRLFVTTGIHKSIEEENAGRVFVIDGLGVNGTKAFSFVG
ncbi:MAG: SMP-30/gluconolactonase/LRE family protein [Verrucomicrobiota bacterium]|nr:SMP-30/gluconolactonase/LRE family protein [Verrucomicrobiota bacterium]